MKKIKVYLDNCCFNRPFDYTEWHRDLFADKSLYEVNEMAIKYCEDNPDE